MKMPNILSSIKRIALSENEYHALLKVEFAQLVQLLIELG